MTSSETTYISNKRSEPIPACSVDIPYLKSLCELAAEINTKAIEKQLATAVKEEGATDEQFEEFKNTVRELFKLKIFIYGSKGEVIIAESKEIFDSTNFPYYVNRVSFDNTTASQLKFQRNPLRAIRITFDFTKPDVFDWEVKPSYFTPNNSSVELEAADQEWLEWAYNRIKDSIRTREKKVYWWHRSHVYDLLLWLVVIPLLFWQVYKFEVRHVDALIRLSSVFKTALYLYAFLSVIYLFMLLFNYIRWAFPYQEFTGATKSTSMIHKAIIVTVVVGIGVNLLSDFVKYIIPLVF